MSGTWLAALSALGSVHPKQINIKDYHTWTRKAMFDLCRGVKLGPSFCQHFDIHDNILLYCDLPNKKIVDYINEQYVGA